MQLLTTRRFNTMAFHVSSEGLPKTLHRIHLEEADKKPKPVNILLTKIAETLGGGIGAAAGF